MADWLAAENLRRAEHHLRVRVPDLDGVRERALAGDHWPAPPWIRRVAKTGGGVRRLAVPAAADRVLQRALVVAHTDRLERPLTEHVHGWRPGRGVGSALRHLARQVGQSRWIEVVRADFRDLFDALDHALLADVVAATWSDPLVRGLVGRWARAYGAGGRGVGQGGPLSPALANLYLASLVDPEIARAGRPWIRYGDDVVVVGRERGAAVELVAGLYRAAGAARLELAAHKTAVVTVQSVSGIRVLGQVLRARRVGDRWALVPERVVDLPTVGADRLWGILPGGAAGNPWAASGRELLPSRFPAWLRSLKIRSGA